MGTILVVEWSGRWVALTSKGIGWPRIALLGSWMVILKAELGSLLRDENTVATFSFMVGS